MTDFESRLRESLAERAEDVVGLSGLAAGARVRLRARRTVMAKLVAALAPLAAAPLAIAALSAMDVGSPAPLVAPDASFVVPDLSRDLSPVIRTERPTTEEITWLGVRFTVPAQWQPGATTGWCARGTDPAAMVPRITLPDTATPKIACTPANGYGVTVSSAATFEPVYSSRHVWQYEMNDSSAAALYPDGAWVAVWYDNDLVVSIVTPDPGLTSRIAQSVQGEEVDANGCRLVYDDEATRSSPGPRGVGAALCRYSTGGELKNSQRLTYVELDHALAALGAAPELPELPDGGDCQQEAGGWVTLTPAGGSAYLARYATEGAGSCQDGVESMAPEQLFSRGSFELTPEVVAGLGLGDLE